MRRLRATLLLLMVGFTTFLLTAALVYRAGMERLEGRHRTFWQSFEWASETISTTGYGADSSWSHPLMVLLVAAVQIAGVITVPLLVTAVIVPLLSRRFEARVPRTAPEHIHDHVVVYRFGAAVETLLQRLREFRVPALVVELDEATARAVLERGEFVVFSRSEEDVLDVCRMNEARALVCNGRDEENAAMILRARQSGFRGEIYTFVEDPGHRKAMELAGASRAYTPRHLVAAALAAHASEAISPRLPGLDSLPGLERREIRIPAKSASAGHTAGEFKLEATVIGMWHRSRLQMRFTPSTVIEPGCVFEVVGTADAIRLTASALDGVVLRDEGPILIAGFGEVGRRLHEMFSDAGEPVRVVERRDSADVDVVGDVLDSSVLERAGLREARALVLALDSDDATLFATVIARDVAPDVAIFARVNHARNLDNIHRAGADYALSISDISGEMLSSRILGRNVRARDAHRRLASVGASGWSGRNVAEIAARSNGCTLIALQHEQQTEIPVPSRVIAGNETLWFCGSPESLRALTTPS